MAVCSPFDPDDLKNENKYTNVEYSEDGSSLTIYLDGSARVPVNRALSKSLAILGHDFFEVTFMYRNSSGQDTIARGSWEIGEPAGVNGVWRGQNGAGADYGARIGNANATNGNAGFISNDTGTAILFAGKKTDKTLLAVGALTGVDGGSSKVITSTTTSVSFALNALKAGATADDNNIPATASILTDSTSNGYGSTVANNRTKISLVSISHRSFPAYAIPKSKIGGDNRTELRYAINVVGDPGDSSFTPPSTPDQLADNRFEYYRNGIVYADQSLRSVTNLNPHFTEVDTTVTGVVTTGVGKVYYADSPYVWHNPPTIPVAFRTQYPMTPGAPLRNPISFGLNPVGGDDNYLFSFAFQLPVNALSNDSNPVTWFIRNGYDKYAEELDDGYNGSGGAILIAIGNIASAERKWLEITNYPRTQYNPNNNQNNPGDYYDFFPDAIQLQYHNGTPGGIVPLGYNSAGITYAYSSNLNADPDTESEWTTITKGPVAAFQIPASPPETREFLIRVRYTISTEHYDAVYRITVSNTGVNTGGVILATNRFVVSSSNSWEQFKNVIQNRQGVYLLVFSTSFNIPDAAINISGDLTLIITANYPNVIIGRTQNTTFTFNGNGNVTVFMGKWPFDEPVLAGGDVLIDYPFKINAGGTWQSYPNGALSGVMFRKGSPGSLTIMAPGIEISGSKTTSNPLIPIIRNP